MVYYITIAWLLLGLLGVWIVFHSVRKDWYKDYEIDYWQDEGKGVYKELVYLTPILSVGGIVTLFLCVLLIAFAIPKSFTFYFKIPKS